MLFLRGLYYRQGIKDCRNLTFNNMKRAYLLLLSVVITSLVLDAQVKVVAHRGFWNTEGSDQNTLASFVKADSIGCYGSEIDVWLTTDDELVVNHDKKFHGLYMETAPFDKIRKIKLKNGEKIPTLDEYLAVVKEKPATRLVLEMKSLTDYNREDEACHKIAKLLTKYGVLDRTDIIVFSLNAAMTFKKIFPVGVKIFYLDGDLTPKKLRKLGLAGLDYSVKVLKKHPNWVKEAHEQGLEVNVWTVNTDEDMKYFIDLGVDYITTDHPDRLLKLMKDKK